MYELRSVRLFQSDCGCERVINIISQTSSTFFYYNKFEHVDKVLKDLTFDLMTDDFIALKLLSDGCHKIIKFRK